MRASLICLLIALGFLTPGLSADTNDAALQELLRGSDGVVKHWNQPPALVVLDSVMMFRTGEVNSYSATSERLTTEEVDQLVSDLTAALRLLTGGAYDSFSSVHLETVAAGSDASVLRPGQIVVARYQDVQHLLHTIGLGGSASRADGSIRSAAIILDDEFDRGNSKRGLLRMHELGHALGYNHVRSRISIMNPNIGPEPTLFDREAARVAFHVSAGDSN